jgi:hypothetical protein
MFPLGKREFLRLSFRGVVVLAIAFSCADLAPRIGLAYSPSPKWALRAGFRVFFDRYLLAAVNGAFEKNGLEAFEQVADGQAATQIFQSELGGSALCPVPSIWSLELYRRPTLADLAQ